MGVSHRIGIWVPKPYVFSTCFSGHVVTAQSGGTSDLDVKTHFG